MWCIKVFDKLSFLLGRHTVPVQSQITSFIKAPSCKSLSQFTPHFCLHLTFFSSIKKGANVVI